MNKDGMEEQEWAVVVFLEKASTEEQLILKSKSWFSSWKSESKLPRNKIKRAQSCARLFKQSIFIMKF